MTLVTGVVRLERDSEVVMLLLLLLWMIASELVVGCFPILVDLAL